MGKFIVDNLIGLMLFIGFMAALILFRYFGVDKARLLLVSFVFFGAIGIFALPGNKYLHENFYKNNDYSFYRSYFSCEKFNVKLISIAIYFSHVIFMFFCGIFICSLFIKG